MTDHTCDPTDYLTIEAHNDHCEGMKRWADSVIKTSEEDRHRLWDEVKEVDKEVQSLAGLVTKFQWWFIGILVAILISCLLYTSDAADDLLCVDLGGRSILKKKNKKNTTNTKTYPHNNLPTRH